MAKGGVCAAVALLLVAADAPQSYDWSTADLSYLGDAHEYRTSRALCAGVIHAVPPAADQPKRSEVAGLKGCDSEALYFGIGRSANPEKARKCAFVEAGGKPYGGPPQPYYGNAMLAIIYANGRGAAQDYDVALHYVCGLDNAAAETKGRVERLAALRSRPDPQPRFDTCLDTTSGFLGGWCSAHEARVADQRRARQIAAVAAGWSPSQRGAFERVRKSADRYAETLHQMDCFGGTAQSQCTISGADQFMTEFTMRIVALAGGQADRIETKAMTDRRRQEREIRALARTPDAMSADDKREYGANDRAIRADRAAFERGLVEFARLAFPAIESHRIRRIFSDL